MEKLYTSEEKEILSDLGLGEKEASIYLAALHLGAATISDLAEYCHVERTGIYYHIDKLLKLKLIKASLRGRRTYYLPSDPERLRKIIEHKKQRFDNIFPKLEKRFSRDSSKSIIQYFEGEEEVDHFYSKVYDILSELKEPDNVVYILGNSYKAVIETSHQFLEYEKPENKLNLITKAIMPAAQKRKNSKGLEDHPYITTRYNLPPAELKYLDKKYIYPGSVVITSNMIALYDWRNLIFSITENKNNATTWRMFFEFIWDHL